MGWKTLANSWSGSSGQALETTRLLPANGFLASSKAIDVNRTVSSGRRKGVACVGAEALGDFTIIQIPFNSPYLWYCSELTGACHTLFILRSPLRHGKEHTQHELATLAGGGGGGGGKVGSDPASSSCLFNLPSETVPPHTH